MLVLDKKIEELKVLISEDEIKEKLITLAENIEKTFSTDEEIYVICVLKGSVMFCTDLVKHFKHPIQMEFIRISSYGHESKSTNNLQAIDLTLPKSPLSSLSRSSRFGEVNGWCIAIYLPSSSEYSNIGKSTIQRRLCLFSSIRFNDLPKCNLNLPIMS